MKNIPILILLFLLASCSNPVSVETEEVCYKILHEPSVTDEYGNPLFYKVEVPCSDKIEIRVE